MSVSPVGAIANAVQAMPGLAGINTTQSSIGGLSSMQATGAAQATGVTPASGSDFGNLLAQSVDNLEGVQNNSSNLAVQAATGSLGAIQDYTIASTEASVETQLAVTLRNQAVSAFNQILNMPA